MSEGLFGPAPWQIQQQRQAQDAERANQFAQMNATQRGVASLHQAGAGLGRMGAGMMGLVDPAEQQAKMQQEIMQGADLQTPEGMIAAAQKLNAMGMPQQAFALVSKAKQLQAEAQKNAREEKKQTLAEERGEAQIERDNAIAERALRPNWDIKTIKVGDDKIQDVKWDRTGQYDDVMLGTPYTKDGDTGGAAGKGGSVRTFEIYNPSTNQHDIVTKGEWDKRRGQGWEILKSAAGAAGSVSAAKAAGKGEAKVAVDLDERVVAGKRMLPRIDATIKMLDSGQLNVGPGSELAQGFDRAKVFFLNSRKSKNFVSDTETLKSMLGSEVFGFIQSLGIGARGMDTPAEREFLMNVMTGDTPLTKETLRRLAVNRKEQILRDSSEFDTMKQSGEYGKRTGNRQGAGAVDLRKKYNLGGG